MSCGTAGSHPEGGTTVRISDVASGAAGRKPRRGGLSAVPQLLRTESPPVFVGIVLDITERMRAQERLHHLAHHDPLTGLPNRALFMDRLQQGLRRARRLRCSLAEMFLDVDRFKIINDTLGHFVGDQTLVAVAERLTSAACSD